MNKKKYNFFKIKKDGKKQIKVPAPETGAVPLTLKEEPKEEKKEIAYQIDTKEAASQNTAKEAASQNTAKETASQITIKEESSETVSREMPQEERKTGIEEVISFLIADKEFAINILNIIEIVIVEKINPISNAEDYVEGIYNLRGEMLPVINIERKLGLADEIAKHFGLITMLEGRKVCILTKKIMEVVYLSKLKLFDPPIMITGLNDYLYKIIKFVKNGDERIISIINLDNLFSEEEKLSFVNITE